MADDDDDPQLHSMRAAWRSLPDEDPPERGLAELMAAARQHATVMADARVPWWKMLLRPPVLALATVLVLIGGVFAVTATHKGVSSEPAGVEDQSTVPAAAPQQREAPVAPSTGEVANPPPSPAAVANPPPSPAAATPPALEKPRTVAPAHHTAPRSVPAQPLAEPPPPPAAAGGAASAADDEADAPAPSTRAPVLKASRPDLPTPTRRQLDDQLLGQARSAAGRGDCETAKKIAARIQADDPEYYAQSVTPDAALAKCLSD
ncbi:MAG TPA: hypothetical protein VGG28_30185 [Kofleriaceae bacterium]|jgi:hypothetical protein